MTIYSMALPVHRQRLVADYRAGGQDKSIDVGHIALKEAAE